MDQDSPPAALVLRIDALLPQTQCRRCGYDGCLPYAEAIAQGAAATNRCPPGGEQTAAALAQLLALAPLPLDRSRGEPGPYAVARIEEATCIGCTLCIAACPVDAIVGAAKLMHTVIAERCTGCELCLPPCPVNCIALLPAQRRWTSADAELARLRYAEQRARRARGGSRRGAANSSPGPISATDPARDRRQAAVAAALSRARARRAARSPSRSRP